MIQASRGIGAEAIKLYEVARITLRSRFRYLWDLIGSTLFLGVVMFVFIRLWTVTYASNGGSGTIAGFSLAQMIWYLVATETIIMSMTPIHRNIEREIKDGDVAIRLNKPLSFLGYHWSVFVGEGLVKALILIAVGGTVASLVVGGIQFPALQAVLPLFFTFLLTSTLNFLYGAIIGLFAFWTEDITGLFFVVDRVKWLLGGFLMPISLFPTWLREIVEWLPFSLMIYRPAELAVNFSLSKWVELTWKQVLLLVAVAAIAQGLYKLGVRRLDTNGG